ncbi:aldehyde dehydrogenase [Vallitalea pronyensis]|uniref:Aldehyde dehydrogenase n=1 Tax=Vallitalea pronyensis TaxID=1348613 RepID=A0A8J8MK86_9FIRM|nr:aldehyde dehydrogenase [Vallitalea pronyensis]QUI23387.1 aldehyde dehydrogenase [Vallitalea pronyensis]
MEKIETMMREMKSYFYQGKTKSIDFRIKQLSQLKKTIENHEAAIINALHKDLGRHPYESYTAEIGTVLSSIRYHIKHIKQFTRTKKVKTPLHQLGAKSYIQPEPYGLVLVIGPYNYPFNLLIEPLIGAIAAGNCIVLKPSEQTPHVTKLIHQMFLETFNPNYIRIIEGEKDVTSCLIHAPFDYIFFTGSVRVGKIVMAAASENLVPVTLELGGKSPCIIDNTANIEVAAKRVLWGKFFNAGQTCIAPDYALVHESIRPTFIDSLKKTIEHFYGKDVKASKDFARIINEKHTQRLAAIIDKDRDKIIWGGQYDRTNHYIAPTLIDNVTWEDASMEDELFGPILPIMTYKDLDDAIHMINQRPKPLALYLFSEDKDSQQKVLTSTSSGGSCVNDTVSHFVTHHLPFGGVGQSGMGAYHGLDSFKTFTHYKSVLHKSTRFNLKFLFPPYNQNKLQSAKKVLR